MESLRDQRLLSSRAVGARAIYDIQDRILKQESSSHASKLSYAKSGGKAFGTVSYLLFKKRVANKMGQMIPSNLSSFAIEGSDEIARTSFQAILSCVFSFVEAAFIEYEEEIDTQ
jgi:hypothetical protein